MLRVLLLLFGNQGKKLDFSIVGIVDEKIKLHITLCTIVNTKLFY